MRYFILYLLCAVVSPAEVVDSPPKPTNIYAKIKGVLCSVSDVSHTSKMYQVNLHSEKGSLNGQPFLHLLHKGKIICKTELYGVTNPNGGKFFSVDVSKSMLKESYLSYTIYDKGGDLKK